MTEHYKIVLGSDHVGFDLKEPVKEYLLGLGCEVEDIGVFTTERTDYPKLAHEVAAKVTAKKFDSGLLFCGTGVGMAIAANKVAGIRAVVCSEPYSAQMARAHNDANILALGARVVGVELAKCIVDAWLSTPFEGGRHANRLEMIRKLEVYESV